jgi:hypothetical protein
MDEKKPCKLMFIGLPLVLPYIICGETGMKLGKVGHPKTDEQILQQNPLGSEGKVVDKRQISVYS